MLDKIDFKDWFDIENAKHREAYVYLRANGVWPDKFLPDGAVLDVQLELYLAEKYIRWLEGELGLVVGNPIN